MVRATDAAAHAAHRQLRECGPPIYARTSTAGGLSVGTVQRWAAREGWISPDYGIAEKYFERREMPECIRETAIAGLIAYDFTREEAINYLATQSREGVELNASAMPAMGQGQVEAIETAADQESDTPETRLEQLGKLLSRQIGLFVKAAETSRGILRKDQIDALSAMLRLAERFEAKDSERDAQRREQDDESFARFAARVDQQIIRFARHYAERMVRAEAGRKADEAVAQVGAELAPGTILAQ